MNWEAPSVLRRGSSPFSCYALKSKSGKIRIVNFSLTQVIKVGLVA
ncbi:hypothetical protein NIES2100_42930 [Calothrix sp. NIES-2100]|nr:hypothetical protein NIES2100_42930 [Calothrix sp. NIES-2100]